MTEPATPIRKPRSLKQAQRLCELFVDVDTRIAALEEARDVAIAAANRQVDADLAPLLKERAAIEEKIEPWFMDERCQLLEGKRKSFELGGCELGARKGKDKLGIAGDKADAVKALEGARWAKPYLKSSVTLDVAAIGKGLLGKHEDKLREQGFSIMAGTDAFFIKRTAQGGTQAKVQG